VVLDAQQVAAMKRALIVSDGRPGHFNQSVALTKYLNIPYDLYEAAPRYRWSKAVSYFLDRMGIATTMLFCQPDLPHERYDCVIGTGSRTYYMTKVLARQLNA
jgi:hypothetical protein